MAALTLKGIPDELYRKLAEHISNDADRRAFLAQQDFTASDTPIEGPRGLASLYARQPNLAALADRSYPHDRLLIPISGQFTDNSPPTTVVCDIIKAWNEKWVYPRLRTATLKDSWAKIEAKK